MPKYILRLNTAAGPRYMEWSTIVDAPITWGMTLDQFKAYYRDRYGWEGARELPKRLERIKRNGAGHSSSGYGREDIDELIACNRAGANESEMTLAQIIEFYCPPSIDHLSSSRLCWRPGAAT